jgi:uncharacterized RDD family membrane protein YckC
MREITITTPEHVEVRLEPAGAGSRFLAISIDSIVTRGAPLLIFNYGQLLPHGIVVALYITIAFVLTLGWHVYFDTRRGGRSPGKRFLGLRVVDARGLPISLHQSIVRNIVRELDFAPAFYGIGTIASLVDRHRRRLGDLVAGTLVIREAKPLQVRGQITSERKYNSLRTTRVLRLIKHRVSLEEREFLLALCLRAGKMRPEARYDLMEEVANAFREKLDIEEEQISGENFVRDLTAVLFAGAEGRRRV